MKDVLYCNLKFLYSKNYFAKNLEIFFILKKVLNKFNFLCGFNAYRKHVKLIGFDIQ